MQYRKLGNLEVSAIGIGCMGMSIGYGPAGDKKEMFYLMHQAVDLGVTLFDTAEAYGPYTNEALVGEGLKAEGLRNKIALAWLLAQKPFIVPIPGVSKYEYLKENLGAVDIRFTPEELEGIANRLQKIEIVGDRLCEAFNTEIERQKQ